MREGCFEAFLVGFEVLEVGGVVNEFVMLRWKVKSGFDCEMGVYAVYIGCWSE